MNGDTQCSADEITRVMIKCDRPRNSKKQIETRRTMVEKKAMI